MNKITAKTFKHNSGFKCRLVKQNSVRIPLRHSSIEKYLGQTFKNEIHD